MALYRWSTKLAGIWAWFNPTNLWTNGQVLTRNSSWYGYADAPVTSVWWATWTVWLKTINNESIVWSWNIDIWWWADYSWVTKTISWWEVELSIRTIVDTPTSDFTLTAPSELAEWEEYVIRVINEMNYTMSLWTWFTNPRDVNLELSYYATDQFVFLAVWWVLELQPLVATWE